MDLPLVAAVLCASLTLETTLLRYYEKYSTFLIKLNITTPFVKVIGLFTLN